MSLSLEGKAAGADADAHLALPWAPGVGTALKGGAPRRTAVPIAAPGAGLT